MPEKVIQGERFQVGEVWQSPRGFLYKVVDIAGKRRSFAWGRMAWDAKRSDGLTP